MNKTFLAVAGAFLLSTTSLTIAQDADADPSEAMETAPAESAGEATPTGEAAGAAETTEGGAPATAEEPAASDAAAAQAGEPAAGASGEAAPQEEAAGAGDGEAAAEGSASLPEGVEIDASPSADTAANGIAATEGDLGKWVDSTGVPVYHFGEDGTPDWYTWRGYNKYTANCMQCHGPDGLGSTFAPNLTQSIEDLSYYEFAGIVVSGQQNKWRPQNSIMPAWGEDPNVMCSLDAIYVYLRGRADGVIGRGEPARPPKTETTQAARDAEYECLGF